MRKLVGSALVSLTTTALAAVLLAPAATASPIGDAEAAIMAAWEKAGGDTSPLGARKGDVYPVGDGFALDFDGGKMFFTPATGAKFAYGPILDKYESLGGPAGSDLGFPTTNETDGGIGPSSRIATFSAPDKPVIFWTADHGAFVVRGAMRAAWDKLRAPAGKLGAPVGDQAVDGDVISQQFTGGKISWNRAKNAFSTDPSNLAPLLSGLQISGQNQPSSSAMPAHPKKFSWHWWWLMAAVPVAVLLVLLIWVLFVWRRRRPGPEATGYGVDHGYDAAEGQWGHDDADVATEHFGAPPSGEPPAGSGAAARVSWQRQAPADGGYGFEEEDPDAVDTDSIPVVSDEMLAEADYPAAEADYTDYTDAVPEVAEPETADDAAYADADYAEVDYPDVGYREDEYPDLAVPHTPPDADAVTGGIPAAEADDEYAELAAPQAQPEERPEPQPGPEEVAEAAGGAVAAGVAGTRPRSGRHAAADEEDASENGLAGPDGRPTIHLPLEDPYQAPEGYPIKASARYGLYYTPGSDLYRDTLPELWLSSEEVAQANGFTKAD